MQTSLDSIAYKAKKKKNYRFSNLYGMLNQRNLEGSFKFLNKRSARGVDKVSARAYGTKLKENVENLIERLKRGAYRAKLVRRKYIPKSNGKQRPLGIPSTEDKLLQVAATRIVNAIFEQDFIRSSFGYRPKLGAKDAILKLKSKLQFGRFGYVVEADIKGFFNNINHDWLIKMLKKRINDKRFLQLIRKWLKAGILEEDGEIIHPYTGTPQGGIVSPVLANVYLHFALDLWFQKVVCKQIKGKAYIFRYADDFVCLFQYKADAERFYSALPRRLEKFGLEVAPEKTLILKFSKYEPAGNAKFNFLGFEFKWGFNRDRKPQLLVQTSRKKLSSVVKEMALWCKENRHMGIGKIMKAFNTRLRGHYNYFGIIGNSQRLKSYYFRSICVLKRWLNRRSQKRSYNWSGFYKMLNFFKVATPKITQKREENIQLSFC